jgi:hypothetical protein
MNRDIIFVVIAFAWALLRYQVTYWSVAYALLYARQSIGSIGDSKDMVAIRCLLVYFLLDSIHLTNFDVISAIIASMVGVRNGDSLIV